MTQKERSKLIKVLALLSSDKDGEVLGAAKAAIRILEKNNSTFDDVIGGVIGTSESNKQHRAHSYDAGRTRRDTSRFKRVNWSGIVDGIFSRYYDYLNEWEQDFMSDMFDRRELQISDNQWKVIRRIAVKMEKLHGY